MEGVQDTIKRKSYGTIDIAKLIFSVSVVYIHTGLQLNAVSNTLIASIINSFNSIAVPFFFITSGFFFFEKVDSLQEPNGYIKKYFIKTIKMYTIWSLIIYPFRTIQSGDNVIVAVLKFLRIYIFIGDGQLWYLHALLLGILFILILRKLGEKDEVIFIVSCILFVIGRCIDPYVSSAYADSTGVLKLYYILWGPSTKTGLLMGMFYVEIGHLFSKCKVRMEQLNSFIPEFGVSLILLSLLVYCNYNELFVKHFILPVLAATTFCFLIIMSKEVKKLKNTSLLLIRDTSTVIYLCHYVFVRFFNTFNSLGQVFLGLNRFCIVLFLSVLMALFITLAGRKYTFFRTLW